MNIKKDVLFVLAAWVLILAVSCKHEPLFDPIDPDPDPNDTTKVVCDSTIVYFQQQVLPIFQSNCALSGCHNSQSATKGIILDSYSNIMATAGIRKDKPRDSKIMKDGILEDDPEDIMPPLPSNPLSSEQINLILKWIEQGSNNNSCMESACDTTNVTYALNVRPIIVLKCQGCHHSANASGGVDLSTYNGIRQVAINGRLMGAVKRQNGFVPMPPVGAQLPDCEITQLNKWVESGAPNN
jgi:uncharacterized membrane protein